MSSFLLSITIFMLSISAQAAATAFLNPDPIIILVQGPDNDAQKLFDSLNVPATQVTPTVVEKKIQSPSGQISIECRHAEGTLLSTSCTVKIKRDTNLEVSNEKKSAYLVTYNSADTAFLFDKFTKDNNGLVPMYNTEKQDFAYASSPERFILSYLRASK